MICLLAHALAADRLTRTVDALPASSVRALAQSPDGQVWAGTHLGLWVHDGQRARRVAPDALPGLVDGITFDAEGTPWVHDEHDRVVIVADPPREACDAGLCATGGWTDVPSLGRCGGAPCLVRAHRAWRWSGGAWTDEGLDDALAVVGDGWVTTRAGLYRWDAPGAPVAALSRVIAVAEGPATPGIPALAALDFEGQLWDLDGAPRVIVDNPGRGMALVRRGAALWAAFDRELVRVAGSTESLGLAEGIRSGGPLLVDHDGALWLGNFDGAHVFPEPDTRIHADPDGLPSAHVRYLALVAGELWIATWQGISRRTRAGTFGDHAALQLEGGWCVGPTRDVAYGVALDMRYTPATRAVVQVGPGGATIRPWPGSGWHRGCAVDAAGVVWLSSDEGLWRLTAGGPTLVTAGLSGRMYADGDGVWVVGKDAVELRAGVEVARVPVESTARVTAVLRVGEELWIATEGDGVLRLRGGRVEPLVLDPPLPRHVLGLSPADGGDVWIAGPAALVRVRLDPAGSVTVTAHPGAWEGLPLAGAEDVLDADGTLWVATPSGLVEVPPTAWRDAAPLASPAPLRAAAPSGRDVVLRGGIWELPPSPNELLLRFALPTFRDPTLGALRATIDGRTFPLQAGELRFVDLAPGPHRIEVAGRLGDAPWRTGATVDVDVAQPWWARPGTWIVGIGATLGAALLVQAARARQALRIERERMRIALDLHDELGSGLAGIAALAQVAAAVRTDAAEGRVVAGRIAGAAEELGAALGDIVGSLRKDSGDPAGLLALLAERGNRLLAAHDGEVRIVAPPAWPSPLALPVRRALQRIALEAMHNAARHGNARRVTLTMTVGPWWTLTIEDEAGDAAERPTAGSGLGLPGMQARAAAVGAEVVAGPTPTGFSVHVRFRPGGRTTRWLLRR